MKIIIKILRCILSLRPRPYYCDFDKQNTYTGTHETYLSELMSRACGSIFDFDDEIYQRTHFKYLFSKFYSFSL